MTNQFLPKCIVLALLAVLPHAYASAESKRTSAPIESSASEVAKLQDLRDDLTKRKAAHERAAEQLDERWRELKENKVELRRLGEQLAEKSKALQKEQAKTQTRRATLQDDFKGILDEQADLAAESEAIDVAESRLGRGVFSARLEDRKRKYNVRLTRWKNRIRETLQQADEISNQLQDVEDQQRLVKTELAKNGERVRQFERQHAEYEQDRLRHARDGLHLDVEEESLGKREEAVRRRNRTPKPAPSSKVPPTTTSTSSKSWRVDFDDKRPRRSAESAT